MSGPRLQIDGLSKRFSTSTRHTMRYGVRGVVAELDVRPVKRRPRLRSGEFWALDDVSLTIQPGEAVGVIGANGAGKTSLLRVVHGVSRPDAGAVVVDGRSGALIDLGVSFLPFATGRESIDLEATLLGLDPARRAEAYERIVDFADIGEFIDAQVSKYSLGMRMRLGYAIVAALEPELLLIDEVLSVGDIGFQRKCLNFISEYVERGGSVLLVTHDLWAVRMVCSRCIVLDHGRIVADGDVDETVTSYLTDYLAIGGHADTSALEHRVAGRSGGVPRRRLGVDDIAGLDETLGAASVGESEVSDADSEQTLTPGKEPTAPSADREVRVVEVVVTGLDGTAPSPQMPATVKIELECPSGTPSLVCSFTITANGQMVPLARAEMSHGDPMTAPDGRVELCAEIASLPLLGGSYLLRVLVFDAVTGELLGQKGWVDEAVAFLVEEPERFVRTLFRIAGVMVKAEVDWSGSGGQSAADVGSGTSAETAP